MSDVISKRIAVPKDDSRTGMSADALTRGINDHLRYTLGRPAKLLEPKHYYQALSLAVRDRLQDRWLKSTQTYLETSSKVACYLSAEFLLGRTLRNNLQAVGIYDDFTAVLSELGLDVTQHGERAYTTDEGGVPMAPGPILPAPPATYAAALEKGATAR